MKIIVEPGNSIVKKMVPSKFFAIMKFRLFLVEFPTVLADESIKMKIFHVSSSSRPIEKWHSKHPIWNVDAYRRDPSRAISGGSKILKIFVHQMFDVRAGDTYRISAED